MAAAKFSAFEFASEEFNSDLARLVDVFTKGLVKIISEECLRNGDSGEDSENGSKKSSPFSSPKGKAPRKKAAPKRGRPSKEETDVVIETVSDMRSASDDLLSRAEVVRSSSASPRFSMNADSKFDSIEVNLDDMFSQQPISSPENVVEEETSTKKGKAKVAKEPKAPKEKKEKVPKEDKPKKEKVAKEDKPKKEKVVKEDKPKKEKVAKEDKPKKEKVVKEAKPKKGKKGDVSPVTEEAIKEPEPVATVLAEEDDNDGLDAEIIASQEVDGEALEKLAGMVQGMKIGGDQLEEENDYADTGIVGKLEGVITSSQNSQEDEIVIDQDDSQDGDKDDMSQPPPEDEDDEEQEDDDEDQQGDEL